MGFSLGGLLKSAGKSVLKKIAPKLTAKKAMAGAGLAGLTALPGVGTIGRTIGRVARNPVVQAGVGGAVTGAVVGYMADGTPIMGKRRRGRGFTSRDIRQTRRMLRLIKEMQGCVPRKKC